MKIGILGGTFNPVHMGHLVLAQECRYLFGLDRVVFVPAYIPPHKGVEGGVSPEDRLNMMCLSVEGEEGFEVSAYEIDSGGTSYTINTLEHFKKKYGKETELFVITGSDSMEGISAWKEIDRVLALAVFVAAARPGHDAPPGGAYEGRIKRVSIPRVDISSTMIRARVRASKPIGYLVPALAAGYIREKGLYRDVL